MVYNLCVKTYAGPIAGNDVTGDVTAFVLFLVL